MRGWRPQFTLATLLKTMLIFSVLLAALGGLLRERERLESGTAYVFFMLALISPLALMILFSLLQSAVHLWRDSTRRR